MPVIVNEFEVVAEPTEQRAAMAVSPSSQPAAPLPDLDVMLSERRAREQRVRAY